MGTKKPFGFSVQGMRVHSLERDSNHVTVLDKSFGMELKTEEVVQIPALFFDFRNRLRHCSSASCHQGLKVLCLKGLMLVF